MAADPEEVVEVTVGEVVSRGGDGGVVAEVGACVGPRMRSEDLSSVADGAGPVEAAPREPIGVWLPSGDARILTPRVEGGVCAGLSWWHGAGVEGGGEGTVPVGEIG